MAYLRKEIGRLERRAVSGVLLTLLLIGMFLSAFNPTVVGATLIGEPLQESSPTLYASLQSSQPPPTQWNQTYGGTGMDLAHSVIQTSDGGYAIAGDGFANLVKTDVNGNMLWNHSYGGSAFSVVETSDGGYAIAGITDSFGAGSTDFWLVKTDQAGNMVWNQTYGGSDYDYAYSVVQTSDGGYALAGYTFSFGAGSADFWLVKINADGSMRWNMTYGGARLDYASSLVQTADGGYAIAGYTYSFVSGSVFSDLWLVKTDQDGDEQWNRTYGGTLDDVVWSVVQTVDGGYALAGYTESFGASGIDFWLVKIDWAGNVQWNRTYGGWNYDYASSMVQTVDGGYALVGETYSFGAGWRDFWLVKTDSAGNVQWNQTYGGAGDEYVMSLVQTRDGAFAMAGSTNLLASDSDWDFWLVKTDSDPNFIDSDGDGLLDDWEINGIDYDADGTIDFILPGANPNYKDIYIEIDFMETSFVPTKHDHKPDTNATKDVINAFRNSPVNNPNGTSGIALHIEVDEGIRHKDVFWVWHDFNAWKRIRFGTVAQRIDSNSVNILAAKRMAYRYALFLHQYALWNGTQYVTTTSSGYAELPGNDFIVSLGTFTNNTGNRDEQAGALMHELGHTLNLRHGGGDDINGKPNYLSIMSYSRTFPDFIPTRQLDYSSARLPSLNESNLNENLGIQGPAGGQTVYGLYHPYGARVYRVSSQGAINWNANILRNETGVVRNINYFLQFGFGDSNLDVLDGYDDWANIQYNFRFTRQFSDGVHLDVTEEEITSETVEAMRNTTVIGFHDIAITDILPSKTEVEQGYSMSINATVENQGDFTENFNVTIYANTTAIGTQTVNNLPSGTSTVLTFAWNTTGFAKGNYTISAYATPVPDELDKADNNFEYGVVTIVTPEGLVQKLIETIETWNLPKGTEKSLTRKLEETLHLLAMENENGAVHKLMDFINQVEGLRRKKLTDEQANYLMSETQRIIDLIKE